MGQISLHQHPEICSVPVNSQHRRPHDQLCLCLHLRFAQPLTNPKIQFLRLLEKKINISRKFAGSAPLTAVQLLWVNMIMDTLGALALATEPPTDELMKRPPIGRNVGFITKVMWRNIIGQSIYQLAVLAVFNFDGKRLLKLNRSDAESVVKTFIFNTFVFCQVLLSAISSR